MDHEIETIRHEGEVPVHSLTRVSDALPALGIVAAVMGVVHALGSADLPPSEMGALIGHAMVGTFLGVLLAYGFVSPLASLIGQKVSESMKTYECAKVTLLASLNGYAPADGRGVRTQGAVFDRAPIVQRTGRPRSRSQGPLGEGPMA